LIDVVVQEHTKSFYDAYDVNDKKEQNHTCMYDFMSLMILSEQEYWNWLFRDSCGMLA